MNVQNMTKYAVGILIGLVMVAGLIIPVVEGASATDATFHNTGAFKLTDSIEDYDLIVDQANNKFVVNGEDILFSSIPRGTWTVFATDNMFIRFNHYSTDALYLYTEGNAAPISYIELNKSVLDTDHPGWTVFRGISPNGNYVFTLGEDRIVLNKDSSIFMAAGQTAVESWKDGFFIYGTAADFGITSLEGYTITNKMANYEELSGYINGIELNNISFTAESASNSVNATYDRMIVPEVITLEKSAHLSDSDIALLKVIPLIGIICLIVFAAGTIRSRRA